MTNDDGRMVFRDGTVRTWDVLSRVANEKHLRNLIQNLGSGDELWKRFDEPAVMARSRNNLGEAAWARTCVECRDFNLRVAFEAALGDRGPNLAKIAQILAQGGMNFASRGVADELGGGLIDSIAEEFGKEAAGRAGRAVGEFMEDGVRMERGNLALHIRICADGKTQVAASNLATFNKPSVPIDDDEEFDAGLHQALVEDIRRGETRYQKGPTHETRRIFVQADLGDGPSSIPVYAPTNTFYAQN